MHTFEERKLSFKLDSYLHDFLTISDFPISPCTQAVLYTTCGELKFELREPAVIYLLNTVVTP